MEPILQIRHLEKRFGDHQVLRDISFDVNRGDVILFVIHEMYRAGFQFHRIRHVLQEPNHPCIQCFHTDHKMCKLHLRSESSCHLYHFF